MLPPSECIYNAQISPSLFGLLLLLLVFACIEFDLFGFIWLSVRWGIHAGSWQTRRIAVFSTLSNNATNENSIFRDRRSLKSDEARKSAGDEAVSRSDNTARMKSAPDVCAAHSIDITSYSGPTNPSDLKQRTYTRRTTIAFCDGGSAQPVQTQFIAHRRRQLYAKDTPRGGWKEMG